MRPVLIAFQFLTRLPVPSPAKVEDNDIGNSQYYYPLVGLAIGLMLYGFAAFSWFDSHFLNATLLLAIWVLITGALHLDGLADCADAWVGGYADKDKTLAIMKDPRSGPVAIVLLIIVLLTKLAAIETLLAQQQLTAFIIATVLSRSLLPLLFAVTPYVRESGLGSLLKSHQSKKAAAIMYLLVLILLLMIMGWQFLFVVATSLLVFSAIRWASLKRLDGFTGDVAGALVELVEISILISIISLN